MTSNRHFSRLLRLLRQGISGLSLKQQALNPKSMPLGKLSEAQQILPWMLWDLLDLAPANQEIQGRIGVAATLEIVYGVSIWVLNKKCNFLRSRHSCAWPW
jgi:hypothetical protein